MPARTRTIIKHDLFKAWNRNSFGVCMHQSICLYSAWFASTFNFQALIFSRNSKWLFWQAYAANVEDQNQIKSARSSVFSSTWLHGYLHSAPWSRGITLLDSAIILISSLDSKMILRYLKQVPKASSAKYRSNMCSIAVVQVSVQWLHLRTWHLLSSAHNDLNRKARRRHLLQRPELCAAWLLSPLQTHIVNHLHRITYCRKSGLWV